MTVKDAERYMRSHRGSSWETDPTERAYQCTPCEMPGLWGLVDGEMHEKHGPELREFWDGLESTIRHHQDPGILLWGRHASIALENLTEQQAEYVRLFPEQARRVACRGI